MKTTEKKNNKIVTNVLLAIFAVSALGATLFAYDQYSQKIKMENKYGYEKSEMEQHLYASFELIEKNLAEINAREGQLQMSLDGKFKEGIGSPEERIQREINMIEGLISENKQIIADLNNEVGTKNEQLAKYSNRIVSLNKRLKSYKSQAKELEERNTLLTESLKTVADENVKLTNDNEQKDMFINSQETVIKNQENELIARENTINEAYYIIGDYKELKECEIVEKEGGIVGIAATKTLKDNFDKKDFIKIDQREYKTIPILSKDAELISNHHPDSYEWLKEDNEVKWIKIKDPKLFWENSKYLVIETDNGWDLSLANSK